MAESRNSEKISMLILTLGGTAFASIGLAIELGRAAYHAGGTLVGKTTHTLHNKFPLIPEYIPAQPHYEGSFECTPYWTSGTWKR